MNPIKNVILYQSVPFLAAFVLYFLKTPWYVPVLILLIAPYWYGPVLVYLRQRMPRLLALRVVDDASALPPEHVRFYERTVPLLESAGFVRNARFTSAGEGQPIQGTVALMQHKETSDLAHLLVMTKDGRVAELFGFSRSRIDGSRISTTWSTVHSPFPPNPRDNAIRIGGSIDFLDLWRVHQARVANDPNAKRNDTVTDALTYQTNLEQEGIRRNIASGMWQQDEKAGLLRPTATGALLMCLRMLFPWKQLTDMRAWMEVRRILRESGRSVHATGISMKTGGQAMKMSEARPLDQSKIEQRFNNGANWFFWIAALSIINSVSHFFGSSRHFIVGMGITQFIDGVARGVRGPHHTTFQMIAVMIDLGFVALLVSLGFLARQRSLTGFILGIMLYGFDTLMILLFGSILGVVFHVLALVFILRGLWSLLKLEKQTSRLAPKKATGTSEDEPAPEQASEE